MPSCDGPPDTDCPFKASGNDVHYRYAELDLCPHCEVVRRQADNAFVSNSLLAEASQWENKKENNYELESLPLNDSFDI